MANLRSVLSWAVSEDWIADDPALNVVVRSPPKRKVMWAPEQAEACIAKAKELALHPIAIMAVVFDCIGVSTVDCYTLKHGVYDGRAIDVTRTKTGVSGAPIPLWANVRDALDACLATQPAKLPDAPLFPNDLIGHGWSPSTLAKYHALVRTAARPPKNLQLQDFPAHRSDGRRGGRWHCGRD